MTEALADLQDQVIDARTLDQLLSDIELAAELLDVRVKRGASRHAEGAAARLDAVRPALDGGVAVQLRYVWGGKQWCDTLLSAPGGVRIVRAELPLSPRYPSP